MLGARIVFLQPHHEVQDSRAGSNSRTDTEIATLTPHLLSARELPTSSS